MLLRAIAFDIDGTLYPNTVMYRKSIGLALTRPRLLYHFARVRRRMRHVRPIENFYETQLRMTAESLGTSPESLRGRLARDIYSASERVLSSVPLYEGVDELLHELSGRVKLGVMSDFPVNRKLGILGLDVEWSCSISTEEVGYLKPNPEPFAALLNCFGCAAEHVLYVGNSFRYDVVGASEAGMRTAWLNDRGRKPPDSSVRPDLTFSHYRQLREWLLPRLDPAADG
ncbi:MAG: HAD family hydrolase [Spirochaetales bacterium]